MELANRGTGDGRPFSTPPLSPLLSTGGDDDDDVMAIAISSKLSLRERLLLCCGGQRAGVSGSARGIGNRVDVSNSGAQLCNSVTGRVGGRGGQVNTFYARLFTLISASLDRKRNGIV
jgi:hypothetical protein